MVVAVELSAGPFVRSVRPAIGGALYRPDQQSYFSGEDGNTPVRSSFAPPPRMPVREFYPPGETEGFFWPALLESILETYAK